MIPEELRYTAEHEWVRPTGSDTVRVGITDHAQDQLGDVVFVDLPEVGDQITVGVAFGEVESTKSVSDLIAPVSGEVIAVNDELNDKPELVNAEPYEAGWMLDIRVHDAQASTSELLDAEAYASLLSA